MRKDKRSSRVLTSSEFGKKLEKYVVGAAARKKRKPSGGKMKQFLDRFVRDDETVVDSLR